MPVENPCNIPIERGRTEFPLGEKEHKFVAPAVTAGCAIICSIECPEGVAKGLGIEREVAKGFKVTIVGANAPSECFLNWAVYNS